MEMSMAGGWTRDGAVQDQIDDTRQGRGAAWRGALLPSGEGADDCDECGDPIPPSAAPRSPGCAPASPARRSAMSRCAMGDQPPRQAKDSQLR